MKGTEQSSSSTYSLSKSLFTSPATYPLQVHEGDRQAVDEGHLEEWEGKVAQVIGREEGEEKESFLFAPYFLT